MALFRNMIMETREVLSEDPVGSALSKVGRARGEMAYAKQDRRVFAGGAKGTRAKASQRLNKAQRRLGKALSANPEEDYDPEQTTPGEAAVASGIGKAVGAELGPAGSYVGGKVAPKLVGAWKKYTPGGMAYTAIRKKLGV